MSLLRTIVDSSRALVTTAKDLARLREIARVFGRHGFGWFVRQLKVRRELQLDAAEEGENLTQLALSNPETGKRLVRAFTELGPTWVKFGQIISTRPDLFPPEVIAELAALQDAVDPEPWEEVEAQLKRNLGDDYAQNFASIDHQALASASIGQVHRAVLKGGKEVVLKVQRPGIHPKITADLHILAAIAGYVEEAFNEARIMDLTGMVHDFAKSLEAELDYRIEANNVQLFAENFKDDPKVYLPTVYRDLSSDQVLCMEFIQGEKLTTIVESDRDMTQLVEAYFDMAYRMLFIDGFFHGDLHPGNVFVMDGDVLGIIDCGMVGRLSPSRKEKVIDILWAVLNEDLEAVARTLYDLGIPQGPVDYAAYEAEAISLAERYIVGVPLSQIEIGELFGALVQGATNHSLRMPTDFTMMFKAIMTTEGLAKSLAPDVDPIERAKPYIQSMITERYSPDRLRQVALSDFQLLSSVARTLPRSIPRLLDQVNGGNLTFGTAPETLAALDEQQDRRTRRLVRTTFAGTSALCGTLALGVPTLPVAFWGIPYVSLVFYAFALTGALLLLRKGALL